MSWEDDLDRPTRQPPNDDGEEEDPFADTPTTTNRPNPPTTFGSNRPPHSREEIANHPAMRTPVMQSDALKAAIATSRDLSRDQRSLKASLLAHRTQEQAERIVASELQDDENQAEPSSASELIERLDRVKKAGGGVGGSSSDPLGGGGGVDGGGFRSRIPELTQVQQELLDVAGQMEPPQRIFTIHPLRDRMERWSEDFYETSEKDMNMRLKVLHQQYIESRSNSISDSKRLWQTNQSLHTLSMKLGSIHHLQDFEHLETELAQLPKTDPLIENGSMDTDSYFYDLYSLDLDSYSDIKHLHTSSIAQDILPGTTGWWRTQLSELEEDLSGKRKKAAAVMRQLEEAMDPFQEIAAEVEGRSGGGGGDGDGGGVRNTSHFERDVLDYDILDPTSPSARALRHASNGLILPARALPGDTDLMSEELHAAHLVTTHSRRLHAQQLLSRQQGRSYHSMTTGEEVALPEGQRILQSKKQLSSSPNVKLLDEIEDALKENAIGVNKPNRKAIHM